MNQIKNVLGSQWFHSLWHTLLGGALGYLTTNTFSPTKSWYVGFATAVIGAFVGWMNGTPSNPLPAANPSTPAQGSKLGMIAFALLLAGCTPAFGMNLTGIAEPPAGGEDDLILAPIGAIEFNPSTPNNYGLAISESIAYAKVLPGQDAKHVVVSPYAFVGLFAAADIGQWVATNGNAPWSIDYGVMVGLPKLDDTIPEVAFAASWNTVNRGDAKLMVDVAFPSDILASVLVHKL